MGLQKTVDLSSAMLQKEKQGGTSPLKLQITLRELGQHHVLLNPPQALPKLEGKSLIPSLAAPRKMKETTLSYPENIGNSNFLTHSSRDGTV